MSGYINKDEKLLKVLEQFEMSKETKKEIIKWAEKITKTVEQRMAIAYLNHMKWLYTTRYHCVL